MAKKKQKRAKAAAKKPSRKVVKLATARKTKSKSNGKQNGLPRLSSKPFGQDGQALTGVRILDFTHAGFAEGPRGRFDRRQRARADCRAVLDPRPIPNGSKKARYQWAFFI